VLQPADERTSSVLRNTFVANCCFVIGIMSAGITCYPVAISSGQRIGCKSISPYGANSFLSFSQTALETVAVSESRL
jgi:hypothetical protein